MLLHCASSSHLLVSTLPEHQLVSVSVPMRCQLSCIGSFLHSATLAAFLAADVVVVVAAGVLVAPASLAHIVVYSAKLVFAILLVAMAALGYIVHNL